jgi:predicted membrane GTPase involved in stress response
MIKDRLKKEIENNVTLQLRGSSDSESIDVKGRGELQIGTILIIHFFPFILFKF